MKKHLLFLVSLVALFAGVIKAQPSKVLPYVDLNSIRYNMAADKNDSWSPLSYKNGFHIFIKEHALDSTNKTHKLYANIAYYDNAVLVQLNAIESIELAMPGIDPQNAGKYLYHVVVNDSVELVRWTKPSIFRSNKFTSYAYLGRFNCLGKIVKVEIYEINNYKNKSVLVFNSGYMPPPEVNFVVLNYNNKYLFDPNKQHYIPHSRQHHYNSSNWRHTPIRFQWSAEINNLAVQLNNTLQNDIYHVYLKRTIDGKTDMVLIGNNWEQSYYSPNPEAHINSSYFNRPGQYEIIVKPEMPDGFENKDGVAVRIPFTVLPGPISVSLKTVWLIIAIILIIGGFLFMMYRGRQRRKLAHAAQNKQIATLQLRSVRAQLNPHFIFNALAGIQNLMNKNEVENANKYLSRFARLTRNVLDDGNKELTTIERETDLLRDYLQMEQMRFGFKFNIDVDEKAVDQQTEIPAMLLQPFVENAVKHGVSALKDEGMIKVGIGKKDRTLILTVQDNGKGFGAGEPVGMGMKLCAERIQLLNSIYKNTSILLHQTSDNNGVTITIELINWV